MLPQHREELAGKTIIGIKVKSPTVWLVVDGGGYVEIEVIGDSCSDSFIDSVVLNGTPTLTGESIEIGQFPAKPTTQEVDEIAAIVLLSDNAWNVSILHRNSSDGYYSNYLSVNSRGIPPDDAVDGKCWYREGA